MAEKASLMVEAAKKNEEIERLEAAIQNCTNELNELPVKFDRARMEAKDKAEAAFRRRQDELRARVEGVIAKKRQDAVDLVDTFPDMDAKEFAGKFEVQDLEEHLMQVYPEDMIVDYVCMNPIKLEDDEEAFKLYSSVENMVMSLTRGGRFSAAVFNGINKVLDTVTEDPKVGLKIVPAIVLFYFAGVFLFPFLFLVVFTGLSCASAAQGFYVKSLLRKLYSVKLYLNTSYDEDIFQENKTSIMRRVDDFLEEAKFQYFTALDRRTFTYDEANDRELENKFDVERRRLEQVRDLSNTRLQECREELAALLEKIEELEEAEKKRAERARKEYLETIKWEKQWMEHLFVDVSAENRLLMMPFSKANSCYYSKDAEELKKFSRIVVFQSMLRMHPEYASQVVLDYKYMGGELTQFLTLEGKCVRLCLSEDELRKQQDLIDNEIKARTKSILSSSPNLDEFNALMASYGSTGEYYVIVHIFGLKAVSSTMMNWFRNGPRVGYIFKFYWTTAELQQLKDGIPFEDIKDFYEISGNPIPRTIAAVRRIVDADS